MKIVYIAHPVGGDVTGNLAKIKRIIRDINLTMPEILPFAHYVVDCECLNDDIPEERERGIKNDMHLLFIGFIDELWLFGERISDGMEAEIKMCKSMNVPVIPKTELTKIALERLIRK